MLFKMGIMLFFDAENNAGLIVGNYAAIMLVRGRILGDYAEIMLLGGRVESCTNTHTESDRSAGH
eukprot:COSAG02_NODE_338_length_24206_cov_94.612685_18_plen_65_part_00